MASLKRIAVVTPLFPVPGELHRGLPIYHSVLELSRCTDAQIEVFCPLAFYPSWMEGRLSRADIAGFSDFRLSGLRTHYFGYPALPLVSRPTNGWLSGKYLLPRLRAFRPDLILAYWLYPEGMGATNAGRSLGVPVIVGARGSDLRWIQDSVSRYLVGKTLRQAQAVLTVSSEMVDRVLSFGIPLSRVHTIRNGCDSTTFHYRNREEARALLTVSREQKVILYVGRLTILKGLHDLFQAMETLTAQDPNVHLYCIGGTVVGQGHGKLSIAPALEDHIHLLGAQPTEIVARWMAAADVFCLPSYTEGCPNVVIEAIAMGTPVVATDVGGIPELVTPESGLLVPPRQPEQLASALKQALTRDWDRAANSGVLRRGWESVGRETLAVCQEVFASAHAAVSNGSDGRSQIVHRRKAPPLQLIINADDWGRTPEVNRRIFELLSCGKLTSASILANAPHIEEALAMARRLPNRGFGVHLNCTEFRPLTDSAALKVLLDESGEFKPVIRETWVSASLREAVYQEWCAQIQRVLAAGVAVNHLDSHHHVHNLPQFLLVLRALRKRFGIRRARISMNVFGDHEWKPRSLLAKKVFYNSVLRYGCGFRTPDGCGNFDAFLELDRSRFAGMSVVELMTHPGHPDFESETQLLQKPWRKDFPYQLISYDSL